MNIAILTFEGFNELDSFIASGILNRQKSAGWNIQICCPSETVTSMNGVSIQAQQPLEFANDADVVLVGSGIYTRDIAEDQSILGRLQLDPTKQIIGAQCSGALILASLGLLNDLPVCTDLTTRPWIEGRGIKVLDQPLAVSGNIITAGGCLSSQYLASWVIARKAGIEAAREAIYYVAPTGEKEPYIDNCMTVVEPQLRG